MEPRTLILTKSGGYCVYRAGPLAAARMEYAHFPSIGGKLPASDIAQVVENETKRGAVIVDERA